MPIQDEKHEVVLFLCSHKDITKQKLHEQQQKHAHQLQLDHHHHQEEPNHQPAAAAAAGHQTDAADLLGARGERHADDEQALISMDEFRLDETCADELDEPDDSDDHDKHTASQYSRRRSRAVLYQLSGHYGYRRSVNMKSKLKLNNVSGARVRSLALISLPAPCL